MRRVAGRSKDAAKARRLTALAAIYDGGARSAAARLGHVTLQIVRDWVLRFDAEGSAGLLDRKAPGPTQLLTDAHRQALAAQIHQRRIPAICGVVRWQLCDLGPWLWEKFTALRALPAARVSVSMQTLSQEVPAMGYRILPRAGGSGRMAASGAAESHKSFAKAVRVLELNASPHRTAA